MPHLQIHPATAEAASSAARIRLHATRLRQAHDSAIQRANAICAREPGVISIYALGDVIAHIEADQIYHGQHYEFEASIALNRVLARLKTLLPTH